jgi:exonuclease VII large subunit
MPEARSGHAYDPPVPKVDANVYGNRKVYSVSAFNNGIGSWLSRLPEVWVEGEITELRRQERWQLVFFTLKDIDGPACVEAAMPRTRFDGLELDLVNGERVHVLGRAELWERRGELRFSARTIERFGLGEHPRSPRAAEETARHRRSLRGRAQAATAAPAPSHRTGHGERRSGEA